MPQILLLFDALGKRDESNLIPQIKTSTREIERLNCIYRVPKPAAMGTNLNKPNHKSYQPITNRFAMHIWTSIVAVISIENEPCFNFDVANNLDSTDSLWVSYYARSMSLMHEHDIPISKWKDYGLLDATVCLKGTFLH